MPRTFDVKVTLLEKLGPHHCPNGHKPGDSWICSGPKTPDGMCSNVYISMYPTIWMMQNGGGPDAMKHVCQDEKVMGVFEISRISRE